MRNRKEEVTTNNADIQRIIIDFYEQLYANKIDNMEEMDKFLEKYNLSKLNQEEIRSMNRPTTRTKIGTVIKNLQTNKSPGPDDLIDKFCQKFSEELTPILLTLFQKISEAGNLPNSFYGATITPLPKPGKDDTQKKRITCQYH